MGKLQQIFKRGDKERHKFETALRKLLSDTRVLEILNRFDSEPDFLKELMERQRAVGNNKGLTTLLKKPSKLVKVLEAYSRDDWSEEDKFIAVSNYLEYGSSEYIK